MRRSEVILVAFCLASGAVASAAYLGWIEIAGVLDLGLYAHYSIAAAAGWICGNLYVLRVYRQRAPATLMVPTYLLGPQGVLLLLWQMSPREWQDGAPVVPLLAAGVFVVFFLVPWTLRFTGPPPRELRLERKNRKGREVSE